MPLPSSKSLHISLWVVQILLALLFGMAGAAKLLMPLEELAAQGMSHAVNLPWPTERFIGVSELLGAIGLVLPAATGIQPKLTGFAAIGLVTVMFLGAGYHVVYDEVAAVPVPLVLGGLAAFVAWGRLVKSPISPRGA
jgi:hypothetical protein